jgi:hypothetical protein
MAVLTVRGMSEQTLAELHGEAEQMGRSLTRHVMAVLDAQAERRRRREGLRRLAERLEAVRASLNLGAESAGLLWAERGGR